MLIFECYSISFAGTGFASLFTGKVAAFSVINLSSIASFEIKTHISVVSVLDPMKNQPVVNCSVIFTISVMHDITLICPNETEKPIIAESKEMNIIVGRPFNISLPFSNFSFIEYISRL